MLLYIFTIALITIRFFTDTLKIAPLLLRFTDVLFLIPFILYFLYRKIWAGDKLEGSGLWLYRGILVFAVISVISGLLNLSRIRLYPAIFFLFLTTVPFFYSFLILNSFDYHVLEKNFKLLLFLGILQIPAGLLEFAYFGPHADLISGTFGGNCYQMNFFLFITLCGLLSLISMNKRYWYYFLLFPPALFIILMSGFRSIWVFFFIIIIIITCITAWHTRTKVIAVPALVAFIVIGFTIFNLKLPEARGRDVVFILKNPSIILEFGKIRAFLNLFKMYSDNAKWLLFGTGPGCYNSRAFWIFYHYAKSMRIFPVIGPTDVALKYVLPIWSTSLLFVKFGSATITTPWSSFIGIPGEVGITGALLFFFLYIRITHFVWKCQRYALKIRDENLFTLSTMAFAGMLTIWCMATLGNWFESTRVMLIEWLLITHLIAAKNRGLIKIKC